MFQIRRNILMRLNQFLQPLVRLLDLDDMSKAYRYA